ncbi:hypothetical protein M422DRAFT_58565 [Sphaerobolus stellatus SS14]|nr:hypothetical protein M422DRAFT_58565 [Sphaerobolus stellatus SS14]
MILQSLSLLLTLSTLLPLSAAQNISESTFENVLARLASSATHSWEIGTRAEALTELEAGYYSTFFTSTSIPPQPPSTKTTGTNLTGPLSIAESVVKALNLTKSFVQNPQPQPLINGDGSSGDPASLGVAVLLANWTTTKGQSFGAAAEGQLRFLLEKVPKTSDGAISHRENEVQLWSDSTYMVPPFLAYYGAVTQNKSLVTEAYNQLKLYRSYLRDASADNLWKHIVMGNDTKDDGHWSTGNGWAAAGMLRVLATIKSSVFANDFKSEQSDLTEWITEILDGMYKNIGPSSLFTNYADNNSTFLDGSSTALIAASTYRFALLTGTYKNLPNAEKSRGVLSNGSHFSSTGFLQPVVNPLDWSHAGSDSPEGQAFVVMMQAAWRDWVAQGSPGKNSACGLTPLGGMWVGLLISGVALLLG